MLTAHEPFKALIDVVMLPFDFLSYPGAQRLVNVVSLRGSILRRAHCGNAARSDRLGDCHYDRNSVAGVVVGAIVLIFLSDRRDRR